MKFLNHYRHCDQEWEDEWDCTCDDECPVCGAAVSPYDSLEIELAPKPLSDAVLEFKRTGAVPPLYTEGTKHDAGKPRWSLLPIDTINQVVAVLEHGAKKYGDDNWRYVENGRTRYYDALMRHVDAWWRGEDNDPESGLPHLAHAACCILFLMTRCRDAK